jgi:hypothetical protein
MSSFDEGSTVQCGICGKQTTVQFITEREGGKAYDLSCFHRNGYCETCDKLVRDTSDSILEVKPHCTTCMGELEDDD